MIDFNLKPKLSTEKERMQFLQRSYDLGWDGVAWNTVMFGKINQSTAQKPLKKSSFPVDHSTDKQLRNLVNVSKEFSQYNRITVVVDDIADAQLLTVGNDILKQYDIVAAVPGNAKIFAYLCKNAEIDIISIDFARKLSFSMNKKLVLILYCYFLSLRSLMMQ